MSRSVTWILGTLLLAGLQASIVVAEKPQSQGRSEFTTNVQPFLKRYCVACHGPEDANAELRLDQLAERVADTKQLRRLRVIRRQLADKSMPPDDAEQPSSRDRQAVLKWFDRAILAARRQLAAVQHEHVSLRRLNRREYRNTIRDLFQMNMTMFDPTRTFPRDQQYDHLDTIGESLVTSGYLLARYLDAADAIVTRALEPRQKPKVQTWAFRDHFRQQPELDAVHRKVHGWSYLTLYEVRGADKHEGAYAPLLRFREGVPHDGYYDIRFKAECVNRRHPYDIDFVGTDPNEKFRLGIVPGRADEGALHKPQPVEPLLAEMELEDNLQWYSTRVWLDRGWTPRFVFLNGMMDARTMWNRVVRKYRKQFPPRKRPGIVEARLYAIQYGKLPQIRIHEVEIRGPYFDTWPKESQRALLGEHAQRVLRGEDLSDTEWRVLVARFLWRAYRRPVKDAEVVRMMELMAKRRSEGRRPLDAFADVLKTALCAPAFLYLDVSTQPQRGSEPSRLLTPHALASRLSYFLWSSMPDEALLKRADDGSLLEPAVLSHQVERMLADPRSDAFVNGFLDSWLTLRDLGSMPPDRKKFPQYYRYDLKSAMRRETFLFTRYLLDQNLDIAHFLDSNFTFVNRPLARLYGIKPPEGPGFHKVTLKDRRRGGLLGQASVLTVTANGIDTSPVIRGVWLLENILGTPPSPPPANVEPLDPDVRGTKTIREQLAKHRSSDSCNACHRKIDPPGFALENFDAIGRWRNRYPRGAPVDASAELPGGYRFRDVVEFKRILVEHQTTTFTRGLTCKLLAYACGRPLREHDEAEVDRIVEELEVQGRGLRDLVKLIVQSESFRTR